MIPNPTPKTLAPLFLLPLLLLLSYLAGLYRPNSHQFISKCRPISMDELSLNFRPQHAASTSLPPIASPLPHCPRNFTDYVPCHDPNRERLFSTGALYSRERHCPGPADHPRCRIPAPAGYRGRVPWPESRGSVWFANVPYKHLTVAKADQHWVVLEGERLVFPGGGTSFRNGVEEYVREMGALVPLRTGEVRSVLDMGCGVASFGGHLLDYNILTMSLAPRDSHEAQVQFALERGLPAMLGVLSVHKLPYPSRSFDMAHCARCLIKWTSRDGLYLLEIDRVLRPGGYWVLSGPPISWKRNYKGWLRTEEDLEAEQIAIENLARILCWKKIVEKDTIAVWRKPTDHVHCAKKSKILKSPPFCSEADVDVVWNEKMKTCITPLPKVESIMEVSGGALEKWPERLNLAPPRVSRGTITGITVEAFNQDNWIWEKRISHYGDYLSFHPGGKYRNVMDMNAGMGGFAAAMSRYPVWVMNVVPVDRTNDTLGIIYERGLIGTYMDWCESFSTYPRTYDLIHAHGLFSKYMDKCDIYDILLEMDRILRPEGAVIIRDHVDVIVKVKRFADQLRWQSRIVHSEDGPFNTEKLLVVDNSLVVRADYAT